MNVSFDVDAIALLKAYIVKDDGAETCGNQILLKTREPSFTAKAFTTSSNFSKRRRRHLFRKTRFPTSSTNFRHRLTSFIYDFLTNIVVLEVFEQ